MALYNLPRELRDMIYGFVAVGEQPMIIFSRHHPRTLVTSNHNAGLLLANNQTRAEYREILSKNASVVFCSDGHHEQSKGFDTIPSALTAHTKSVVVILELDGLKPESWRPGGGGDIVGSKLQNAIGEIERAVRAFPALESIEMQWWNDLSMAIDRDQHGGWMSALIAHGVIDAQELWFGYLGGKLGHPGRLREHLIAHRNVRKRSARAEIPKDGFKLAAKETHGLMTSDRTTITPLSFF